MVMEIPMMLHKILYKIHEVHLGIETLRKGLETFCPSLK